MTDVQLNWAAIVLGAVSNMVIGAIWYSPSVFGTKWMKLIGKTAKDMQGANVGRSYAGMMVMALIMSYVLAHFIFYTGANTFAEGMVTGFWVWLGFVMTTHMANQLFSNNSMQLYYLNVGYHLVALVVMGGILGVWQ